MFVPTTPSETSNQSRSDSATSEKKGLYAATDLIMGTREEIGVIFLQNHDTRFLKCKRKTHDTIYMYM